MTVGITSYLLLSFFSFIRHTIGVIFRPYQTYRELTKITYPLEVFFVSLFVLGYIGIASLLKKGLDSGPLLLTLHFGKVSWGIIFTFIFAWGGLYFVGRLFKGQGSPGSLFLPWVYSLLPTTVWFSFTSLFYFFLPPPRTTSFLGQLFSIVFIALTLSLFYWKGILYYLTLRFGHKLSLQKILLVSLVVFPLGIFYAFFTYKIGLFRIPFI